MEAVKKCIKCGDVKPVKHFSKNVTKPDGFQNICKLCMQKYTTEYVKTKKPEKSQKSQNKPDKLSKPGYFSYVSTNDPKKILKQFKEHLKISNQSNDDIAKLSLEELKALALGFMKEMAEEETDPVLKEAAMRDYESQKAISKALEITREELKKGKQNGI